MNASSNRKRSNNSTSTCGDDVLIGNENDDARSSAVVDNQHDEGATEDEKARDVLFSEPQPQPQQPQHHQQQKEHQVKRKKEPTKNITANNNNAFLASMTFASAGRDGLLLPNCDCDECGTAGGGGGGRSLVPETIRAAVREHKRQKLLSSFQHVKRTQNRALVRRCGATAVAVWEWTLPVSAEPLLEFGNAAVDRLLWVQRLPRGRGRERERRHGQPDSTGIAIQSIGTGIVGSSHEEKARVTLDWKEGDVLLVPSNEGKAVGWVVKQMNIGVDPQEETTKDDTATMNTKTTSATTITGNGGPAVFIIVKVPRAVLLDNSEQQNTCTTTPSPTETAHPHPASKDDGDAVSRWSRDIVQIYSKAVAQQQQQQGGTEEDSTANKKAATRLHDGVAAQLKQIVSPMLTN